jgi:hypothetical protein
VLKRANPRKENFTGIYEQATDHYFIGFMFQKQVQNSRNYQTN